MGHLVLFPSPHFFLVYGIRAVPHLFHAYPKKFPRFMWMLWAPQPLGGQLGLGFAQPGWGDQLKCSKA